MIAIQLNFVLPVPCLPTYPTSIGILILRAFCWLPNILSCHVWHQVLNQWCQLHTYPKIIHVHIASKDPFGGSVRASVFCLLRTKVIRGNLPMPRILRGRFPVLSERIGGHWSPSAEMWTWSQSKCHAYSAVHANVSINSYQCNATSCSRPDLSLEWERNPSLVYSIL